jgi:hypothetical protein
VHTGTVVHAREVKTGLPTEYYIHYNDFDRRLDEWVSVDRQVKPLIHLHTHTINWHVLHTAIRIDFDWIERSLSLRALSAL